VNPPREAKAYVPAKERDSYGMASGKSFSSSIEMVIAWPIGCAEAALIFAKAICSMRGHSRSTASRSGHRLAL